MSPSRGKRTFRDTLTNVRSSQQRTLGRAWLALDTPLAQLSDASARLSSLQLRESLCRVAHQVHSPDVCFGSTTDSRDPPLPRPKLGDKQTKSGPKQTSPETLSRPPKKISNFGGAQTVGAPGASRERGRLFLQDAGADAHTGEVSISSPRRATAGVRMSIDRRLGPLFGLNAVWAFQARLNVRDRSHPTQTHR